MSCNSRKGISDVTLFGSILQHYWVLLLNFVVSSEEFWKGQMKRNVDRTVGNWTEEHFLQTIQSNFLIHNVGKKLENDRIGVMYWFRGPLLAHWDRIVSSRSEKSFTSTTHQRLAPKDFPSLYDELLVVVSNEIQAYYNTIEKRGKNRQLATKKYSIQQMALWRQLCDGAAQQILCVSFAFCLAMYSSCTGTLVRWSTSSNWDLYSVYVMDGIYFNSKKCVLDCDNWKTRDDAACPNMQCLQRSHCWILLLFKNGTDLRAVNIDVTSAVLGRYDSDKFGNVPFHYGFTPYIWRHADLHRDPLPMVDRDGPLGEFDKHLWKILDSRYPHLDYNQVELMRKNGEYCYIISGRHRMRHCDSWFNDVANSINMLPAEIQKLTVENTVEIGEKIIEKIRRECAFIEYVNKHSTKENLLAKFQQTLINAIGMEQIYEAFAESCYNAKKNAEK